MWGGVCLQRPSTEYRVAVHGSQLTPTLDSCRQSAGWSKGKKKPPPQTLVSPHWLLGCCRGRRCISQQFEELRAQRAALLSIFTTFQRWAGSRFTFTRERRACASTLRPNTHTHTKTNRSLCLECVTSHSSRKPAVMVVGGVRGFDLHGHGGGGG